MGLRTWWKNRETKEKLREENKRLKEQLLTEYKSEAPIFEKTVKVKKLMSSYTRRYETLPDDKNMRENLTISLIHEIENYLVVDKTFNNNTGCVIFTGTLYIADYNDALSNNDQSDDENIIG